MQRRLKSSKFPEDTEADKQFILNFTLYAADLSTPTKSTIVYAKWFSARMEEYFQQGYAN
jgi:hypothetical protein